MRRLALLAAVVVLAVVMPLPASGTGVSFSTKLTPAAEVPPADADAFGFAWFKVNADGTVDFKLMGHKLSGPALAAHIHASAPPGENAGARVTLCGGGPPPIAVATCTTTDDGKLKVQGTIPAGVVTMELMGTIADGLAYVNVHTGANPGGEMRGQLSG